MIQFALSGYNLKEYSLLYGVEMTISAVAVVQGGQVTIPVGNSISEGKKVRVTVVDAEKVVPMIDANVDIEMDEIIHVPVKSVRIESPVIRNVEGRPSLVGIEGGAAY